MPPRIPEHAVVGLLRQFYITPSCKSTRLASRLTTPRRKPRPPLVKSKVEEPKRGSDEIGQDIPQDWFTREHLDYLKQQHEGLKERIDRIQAPRKLEILRDTGSYAIIGGGITGLAAAHYITRDRPQAKVTIFEGSERLGGWMSSKKVQVEGGEILFEQGPRTLRANPHGSGATILELIQDLGLKDQLILTPKNSEAAKNRYVYYPDHLVKVPGPGQGLLGMAYNILMEPALRWLPAATLKEYWVPRRPNHLRDESIASFLERRLGTKDAADNLVSAVLHGIYAGDINKLSIRSLLPRAWLFEGVGGSILNGIVKKAREGIETRAEKNDFILTASILQKIDPELLYMIHSSSVFSFKDGIGALTTALEKSLRANPNVLIQTGVNVKSIKFNRDTKKVNIATTTSPAANFKKAISTISGPSLASIVKTNSPTPLQSLASIHSVTVMVVNLYFPDPNLLPVHGFGYLIPQGVPFAQNPEHALGVVFDSDCLSGQDTVGGTKITVMLGGHWWDDFNGVYPSEVEGLTMARAVLERHLHITAEPTAVQVGLHRNCIPQYTVGHDERMEEARVELMEEFEGRLGVAGNSYMGVGVGDCVKSARELCWQMDTWVGGNGRQTWMANVTGLGYFMDEEQLKGFEL